MNGGYGAIYIPQGIHPRGVEIWNSGYVTNGATYDAWLSYVELPERYSPIAMYIDQRMQQWVMLVQSANLPMLMPEGKASRLGVDIVPSDSGNVRVMGRRKWHGHANTTKHKIEVSA